MVRLRQPPGTPGAADRLGATVAPQPGAPVNYIDPAMPQGNLHVLRRALPESGPADMGALLELLDDGVEWDYVGSFPEVQTYHGPGEVREFLREWAGAFDDFRVEAGEAIDAGDRIAVHVHQSGRGKETGAEVDNRVWQVFTFQDGKIVHCHGYATREGALEATGQR
jgi:ketosteroid isomerase-like protein